MIHRFILLLFAFGSCKAFLIDQSNKPSPLGAIGHEQIAIASEGIPADYPPIKKEPHDEITVVRSESSYTVPRTTAPIRVQFSENLRELNPEDSAEIKQLPDTQSPYLYEVKEIEVQEQPHTISPYF